MRFGVFVPQGWRLDLAGIDHSEHWATMLDVTRRAEAGPWESVWLYDHFHTVPIPTEEPTYEAWSMIAALGAATSRIRLGQMCTCVGYRNPVYLAKVASTCDTVSGGRVEMGIGAGWYEHEWRAYGYGFPRAGERIAMLDEAVQIMRQAWTTGVATLDGTHYQVDGAIVRPLPVQDGGIPIWIAGGGEQKTLRIVARYADYANFDATPDVFRRKSEVLAEHCREIGRDFDEITRSGDYNVVIGRDEREVQERLDWIVAHYEPLVPADQLERYRTMFRTGPLVGTPELIVERLHEAAKMGLSYAIANFADAAYDPSSMELFASEVIPELADI
jgi:F420-dependent oxidoreductase-like protein